MHCILVVGRVCLNVGGAKESSVVGFRASSFALTSFEIQALSSNELPGQLDSAKIRHREKLSMSKRSASPPAASGKDAEAGPSTSAGPSNNVDSHDAEPPVKRVKTEPEGGEDDEGEAPSSPSVARNDQSGGGRGRNKRRGQGGGVPNTTPGGKDDRIGGPRGNKRMKDKWDSRSRNNERKNKAGKGMRNDEEEDEGGVGADGQPKLPKKKVAMLIGYSGMGYNGSQMFVGASLACVHWAEFPVLCKLAIRA